MSFLLNYPNCGVREVTDFVYGGEFVRRPEGSPSRRELNAYNYFRDNRAGVQREWWYHPLAAARGSVLIAIRGRTRSSRS